LSTSSEPGDRELQPDTVSDSARLQSDNMPDDPDDVNRARRPWMPKFIEALAERGIVTDACKVARISRAQAYAWRKDDPSFALDWDDAYQQAMDALEAEALRRAVRGVEEPVFYKGELVTTVQKYSDTLLMFLLNGGRSEKYRRGNQVEVQVRMGEQAADIIATLSDEMSSDG